MRIAFVFNGQPRWISVAHEFHHNTLFEPNRHHSIDVFAHFWFDDAKIGQPCSGEIERSPSKGRAIWDVKMLDNFKILYKPKRMVVEKEFDRETFPEEFYATRGSFCGYEACSMFSSIKKAMALKSLEEESGGFKYDLVLRTRPDLAIVKPIIFDGIKKNTLTLLNSGLPSRQSSAINCDFAIGDSTSMDCYGNVFDFIEEYVNDGCELYGENLLFRHLYKNGFIAKDSEKTYENNFFEGTPREIDLEYLCRDGANYEGYRQGDCWIIRDPSLH